MFCGAGTGLRLHPCTTHSAVIMRAEGGIDYGQKWKCVLPPSESGQPGALFHQRMKTRRALRFVKGQFGLPPCGIDGAAFPRRSWPPRDPGSPPAGRWLATGKETGKLRRRQCGAYRNEGVICSALSEDRRP